MSGVHPCAFGAEGPDGFLQGWEETTPVLEDFGQGKGGDTGAARESHALPALAVAGPGEIEVQVVGLFGQAGPCVGFGIADEGAPLRLVQEG
jgi:hypothetical protein